MSRITFTDETGTTRWFDPYAAKSVTTEGSNWDGNNWRGACSGLQTSRATLYLTAGGLWIENADARSEFNGSDRYRYLTDDEARDWLMRSAAATKGGDAAEQALEEYFSDTPDESPGPGRPEIGGAVHVKIGDERLARLDGWADAHDVNRAEAIRRLLDRALASDLVDSGAAAS